VLIPGLQRTVPAVARLGLEIIEFRAGLNLLDCLAVQLDQVVGRDVAMLNLSTSTIERVKEENGYNYVNIYSLRFQEEGVGQFLAYSRPETD